MCDEYIPLSDKEVAAILFARWRMADSHGVKSTVVNHVDGTRKFVPVDNANTNAHKVCEVLNTLDEILEPYGYKFGRK